MLNFDAAIVLDAKLLRSGRRSIVWECFEEEWMPLGVGVGRAPKQGEFIKEVVDGGWNW